MDNRLSHRCNSAASSDLEAEGGIEVDVNLSDRNMDDKSYPLSTLVDNDVDDDEDSDLHPNSDSDSGIDDSNSEVEEMIGTYSIQPATFPAKPNNIVTSTYTSNKSDVTTVSATPYTLPKNVTAPEELIDIVGYVEAGIENFERLVHGVAFGKTHKLLYGLAEELWREADGEKAGALRISLGLGDEDEDEDENTDEDEDEDMDEDENTDEDEDMDEDDGLGEEMVEGLNREIGKEGWGREGEDNEGCCSTDGGKGDRQSDQETEERNETGEEHVGEDVNMDPDIDNNNDEIQRTTPSQLQALAQVQASQHAQRQVQINARNSRIHYFENEGNAAERIGNNFEDWLESACSHLVAAEGHLNRLIDISTDERGKPISQVMPAITASYHALCDCLSSFDDHSEQYEKLVAEMMTHPEFKYIIPRRTTAKITGHIKVRSDLEDHHQIKLERFLWDLDIMRRSDLGEDECCVICRQRPSSSTHELSIEDDRDRSPGQTNVRAMVHLLHYGNEQVPVVVRDVINNEKNEFPGQFVRLRAKDGVSQGSMADMACLRHWLQASSRCPISRTPLF